MDRQRFVTGSAADTNLEEIFVSLVARWKAERGPTSFVTEMVQHPAYQQIIALGEPAIPLLFRELERQPDHWFSALRALTGANPVRQENRGKLDQMAQDWLNWGREQGYRW